MRCMYFMFGDNISARERERERHKTCTITIQSRTDIRSHRHAEYFLVVELIAQQQLFWRGHGSRR